MKNIKRAFLSIPALVMGLFLLPVSPAQAADALAICESGTPFAYPAGGSAIPWNPDLGGLGALTNAQAVQAVSDAFDRWEDLPESSAAYSNNGALPVDIDISNFGPVLNPVAPDGLSAIVFDEDGSIFALLFGAGSGILGFAGPDFGLGAPLCELIEGSSFLNGPAFADAVAAEDVMVHEFGHYSNLGHVELNLQIFPFPEGGDDSGPTPNNTTFGTPTFVGTEEATTMYPFYFGPDAGTRTPHADDIASIATIYPDASFANRGTISGAILAPNGTTRLSGVNVIARNINDPFVDAVSTFSGAYTNGTSQADPNAGLFTLSNLEPGEQYAVFVDQVTAAPGRFSNPILTQLPGPEEFWNGVSESSDPNIDDPQDFVLITATAGGNASGTDIIFNQPGEGEPLPVGDDGSVSLFLPFTYTICGQDFDQVFVNANGNLTFGAGDSDFSESNQEMLDGLPRIAGAWDDLNPSLGGSVFFDVSDDEDMFTVTWQDVPEWLATGSNTFSIELKENASQATVYYGDMDMADGLAGVSCGIAQTGGVEPESELRKRKKVTAHNFNGDTAIYEVFDNDNDLANYVLKYNTTKHKLVDVFEEHDDFEDNNSIGTAAPITTPFNTAPNSMFTEISPAAADVDYFSFEAEAGQYLTAEVARGQIDSVLGLFDAAGILIAANDDAGTGTNPLLSRIEGTLPGTGTYYLAVTFCCDFDFDGVDPGQGGAFDEGRYVIDVQLSGIPLSLGDDASVNLPLGFTFAFNGTNYTDVFVNSNGSLTFGSGDTDFSESVGELLSDEPRIAMLWDDLAPSEGGLVSYESESDSLKVTFNNVPEFGAANSNSWSVTLYDTGEVDIEYGNVDALDGIAGVTEGGGAADPGETDLDAAGSLSATGTTYEDFSGLDNDLDGDFLDFNP
jgi:hypothetical protein